MIEQIFQRVYGQPCWNVKSGYGSFMTMEFGKPFLQIREPRLPANFAEVEVFKNAARRLVTVRGQWHLWIHSCEWQVFTGQKRVGHSNLKGSSKHPIDRAAQELDGQKLINVTVGSQGKTSIFEFDLGSRLEARPYNLTDDQWLLYEPSGYVFALRGDGYYSHQSGNTLHENELYFPLEEVDD